MNEKYCRCIKLILRLQINNYKIYVIHHLSIWKRILTHSWKTKTKPIWLQNQK